MYNSNILHIPFQSKKKSWRRMTERSAPVGFVASRPRWFCCVARWKGPSRSYLCRLDMADTYSTLEHMGSRLIAATPNMFFLRV